MYIYNVTINIDESVHNDWLSWIKDHIQDVLATGCFSTAKLTQVLCRGGNGRNNILHSIFSQNQRRFKQILYPLCS